MAADANERTTGPSAAPGTDATLPDGQEVAEAGHPAVGAVFWVSMAAGGVLIAVGLRGLFTSHVDWLFSMAAWFVVGGALVDLALIPLVAIIGLGGRAVLPEWAWRVVRIGLVVTALLVAFSLVLLLQPNGRSANTSVLPRNYGRGLLVYLAVVWALVAAGLAASWFASRSTRTPASRTGPESGATALG